MELAPGDAEGSSPDPSVRSPDGATAAKELCEGLGHGIAGDLSVTAEQQQRTPEFLPLFAIGALDGTPYAGHRRRPIHVDRIGGRLANFINAEFAAIIEIATLGS